MIWMGGRCHPKEDRVKNSLDDEWLPNSEKCSRTYWASVAKKLSSELVKRTSLFRSSRAQKELGHLTTSFVRYLFGGG